jgi:hypothetical protein
MDKRKRITHEVSIYFSLQLSLYATDFVLVMLDAPVGDTSSSCPAALYRLKSDVKDETSRMKSLWSSGESFFKSTAAGN